LNSATDGRDVFSRSTQQAGGRVGDFEWGGRQDGSHSSLADRGELRQIRWGNNGAPQPGESLRGCFGQRENREGGMGGASETGRGRGGVEAGGDGKGGWRRTKRQVDSTERNGHLLTGRTGVVLILLLGFGF
jgi:hypothetical protein